MSVRLIGSLAVALTASLGLFEHPLSSAPAQQSRLARSPIETRWAKSVSAKNVWPEYPRPQMTRDQWMNLNGVWDYAVGPAAETPPRVWDGHILVPFPIESALSGVMKPLTGQERLWYRRVFAVPGGWRHGRVLLHFGAVDWRAHVWVNGKDVGAHQGGYDEFTFDITNALTPSGPQVVIVAVDDPTDSGTQPRGKQVRQPRSIWYTSTTGIWQTVWLEPVSAAGAIESIRLAPDVDAAVLRVDVKTVGAPGELRAEASDGGHVVSRGSGPSSRTLAFKIPKPKLWSPDSPHLYDLTLTLRVSGKTTDRVRSYFGMRKIALGKDAQGRTRMLLNGHPLFEFGPLDQGFWPDGLYTAPTDEALRFDIEQIKALGFNLARKHVKVEPQRWYYWCDKLGLLVWQDMPSGDRSIGKTADDLLRTAASAAEYRQELTRLVESHANHPAIVMWVPFNEGWGQFDTAAIVDLIRGLDPTRLVDSASGWTDRGVGDVSDVHTYPGPAAPALEDRRAAVLGEFGGLGLPLAGHTWQDEKNWGYATYKTQEDLTTAYLALIEKLGPLVSNGLSAAVYTQTSDVEIEVNGLMTYDRAVVKMDRTKVADANQRLYALAK